MLFWPWCRAFVLNPLPFEARVRSSQLPPVIDITADDEDEELRKALTLSLGPTANGESAPVFGPSERQDTNQSWAMVPVSQNQTQGGQDHDHDADLRRAVEASMNVNNAEDHMPVEAKWRGAFSWE